MAEIQLTDIERDAKDFFLTLVTEGAVVPSVHSIEDDPPLPKWYDEAKYNRARKYFQEQRFGVLASNYSGLLTLLADPRGLDILHSTGRSSTVETARRRYASTVMETLCWYEHELHPGSASWTSLMRVRKMHFCASKAYAHGHIAQSETTLTTFGFAGLALLKPHLLGIDGSCREDREALVHFWAVITYMIGTADRFNVCLRPLEVVETVFQIMLRYWFVPMLQIETEQFKLMTQALCDGMGKFLEFDNYNCFLFRTRRVCGIPGYQHDLDPAKEVICRQVFSEAELALMQSIVVQNLQYSFISGLILSNTHRLISVDESSDFCHTTIDAETERILGGAENVRLLATFMGLTDPCRLRIEEISSDAEWRERYGDQQFAKLSIGDRSRVGFHMRCAKMVRTRVGNFCLEKLISLTLYRMRSWLDEQKKKSARKVDGGDEVDTRHCSILNSLLCTNFFKSVIHLMGKVFYR